MTGYRLIHKSLLVIVTIRIDKTLTKYFILKVENYNEENDLIEFLQLPR